MCQFISSKHVMPGYICCRCRSYNGLQRERCKVCAIKPCELEIPENVKRCASCGWGWDGAFPIGNLEGEKFDEKKCPCCGAAIIPIQEIEKGEDLEDAKR